MSHFHLNETFSLKRKIIEMIPCDSSFAEVYLHQLVEQSLRQQAIHAGIADADSRRLISLATVKAKWLPR
jgi:hypothetical protein